MAYYVEVPLFFTLNSKVMESKIRVAAEFYLKKGRSVIPVTITTTYDKVRGEHKKKPIFPSQWKQWQTEFMEVSEIPTWWPTYEHLGLATGKISGLTVIDIDTHDLPEMANLPQTWTVKTRRGFQFYYKYNPDIKQTADGETKIDVRNDGGLVFAPPSEYKLADGVGKYEIIDRTPPVAFPPPSANLYSDGGA